MKTYTILAYRDGDLIAEECGVELQCVGALVQLLEFEGFDIEVIQE
jgi:hypothetical protein